MLVRWELWGASAKYKSLGNVAKPKDKKLTFGGNRRMSIRQDAKRRQKEGAMDRPGRPYGKSYGPTVGSTYHSKIVSFFILKDA